MYGWTSSPSVSVHARVPSPTFYRWLFGWGWDGSIVVEGPEEVSRQYKKMLRKALRKQSVTID